MEQISGRNQLIFGLYYPEKKHMTNVIQATDKILEKWKFYGRLSTRQPEMKVKEDVFKKFFQTELVF